LSEEVKVEDAPAAEPARPEWLPKNFDSPEALVTSYNEAQAAIAGKRELEGRAAEAERRVQELEAQAQQAPQASTD
jgi:hypothetical protein